MRLLKSSGEDDFSLVEFYENIPPYAILSHTWGADDDEVTFKDIYKKKGKGKTKRGYAKLKFCAAQAEKDGIHYFWVDTCCIDKNSSAELSEAINSMFKWYQNSSECYVYLADWSLNPEDRVSIQISKIKWFTRGWTLQELIAPERVQFFSVEGRHLGDKTSLCCAIERATNLPKSVLLGAELGSFPVDERFTWAEGRQTKREEDAAYCLMGLFGIHMPLLYGEGKKHAFRRLREEIASREQSNGPTTSGRRREQQKKGQLPSSENGTGETTAINNILRWLSSFENHNKGKEKPNFHGDQIGTFGQDKDYSSSQAVQIIAERIKAPGFSHTCSTQLLEHNNFDTEHKANNEKRAWTWDESHQRYYILNKGVNGLHEMLYYYPYYRTNRVDSRSTNGHDMLSSTAYALPAYVIDNGYASYHNDNAGASQVTYNWLQSASGHPTSHNNVESQWSALARKWNSA